jgi:hypothetical protein
VNEMSTVFISGLFDPGTPPTPPNPNPSEPRSIRADTTGSSGESCFVVAELGIYHPASENVPSPDSFAERAENWLTYELPKTSPSPRNLSLHR